MSYAGKNPTANDLKNPTGASDPNWGDLTQALAATNEKEKDTKRINTVLVALIETLLMQLGGTADVTMAELKVALGNPGRVTINELARTLRLDRSYPVDPVNQKNELWVDLDDNGTLHRWLAEMPPDGVEIVVRKRQF